jgi:hypothetical protein
MKLPIVVPEFVALTPRPGRTGPAGSVVMQRGVNASKADAARAYVTIRAAVPVPLQGAHASRTTTVAPAFASLTEACAWHQAVILGSTLTRILKPAGTEWLIDLYVSGMRPNQAGTGI